MSVCGLWQDTQRLVAVIIDDDGTLRSPITTPATADNAAHLLAYLATVGIDVLILAERTHTLITQAHALGLHVRIVPHDLLEAIRAATGLTQRPPCDTACLLARWYQTPVLRLHLRKFHQPTAAQQQLGLF